MSNSPLVDYTKISPNSTNPRNASIKKITIHHMAGNLTVEECGKQFASAARKASSNYGIGSDGRVGMYVEEKNRAWSSANKDNDEQAVTIEVANDEIGGNWHVSDAALAKLIELCADICKRNGIKKLDFTGNKKGNLTMHKWFVATTCPGPYLASKFPYIADEVNKILENSSKGEDSKAPEKDKDTEKADTLYRVQTGAFAEKENADRQLIKVKKAGFDAIEKKEDDLYKVQVGAFAKEDNAEKQAEQLEKAGFEAAVVEDDSSASGKPEAPTKKSNKEIAKEIIQGKWGDGETRKKKLEEAGYDYDAIQKIVNQLMA